MQRVEGQPAFVLHAQAYRETSLLVEVFSREHGRTGLIARGVRGARGQPLRAALQPLQPLLLDWAGRGELSRLVAAEAAGAAFAPQGDALLAAFYLNELMVRLLPRNEAMPALFWRYAQALGALHEGGDWIWQLRRFERDLLAELGYALQLDREAGTERAIDPDAHYRYDPEQGPLRLLRAENASVTGASLLALANDDVPAPDVLRDLRLMMRRVLLHQLGGRDLKSWRVLADLAAGR
jgi:DNA repair protein RecO (recombination protein O)